MKPGPTKVICKPSPEQVINGGFDTGDDWTLNPTGWSIAGGVLHGDAADPIAYNPINSYLTDLTKLFQCEFTILNYVSGSVMMNIGINEGPYESGDGVKYRRLRGNGFGRPTLNGTAFKGDIDNVSVIEIKAEIK